MDKLVGMNYFVRAVESKGFSPAARVLLVSPAAVSKAIGTLERELGVSLFHRTTRSLSLTDEGALYYERCRTALDAVADAESSVAALKGRPRGRLVIGMPPVIATHCVMPELPQFLAMYPDLRVELRAIFLPREMEQEGVDVLVRLGHLADSDLVAREIARTQFLLVAAPSYLKRAGNPSRPEDLAAHDIVAFTNIWGHFNRWRLERAGKVTEVQLNCRVLGNEREALIAAVISGAGIVRVPDLGIRPHLKSGVLTPVLKEWRVLDAPPVHLLYRKSQRNSAKIKAFADWVTGLFAKVRAQ